jgi:hypothetical protein
MSAAQIIGMISTPLILGVLAYFDIVRGPRDYQERVRAGKDPITNLARARPKWRPFIYLLLLIAVIVFFFIKMHQDRHP